MLYKNIPEYHYDHATDQEEVKETKTNVEIFFIPEK